MIEWMIGLLVAKWWADKEEKKEKEPRQFSGSPGFAIPFGYVRDGESVRDLQ